MQKLCILRKAQFFFKFIWRCVKIIYECIKCIELFYRDHRRSVMQVFSDTRFTIVWVCTEKSMEQKAFHEITVFSMISNWCKILVRKRNSGTLCLPVSIQMLHRNTVNDPKYPLKAKYKFRYWTKLTNYLTHLISCIISQQLKERAVGPVCLDGWARLFVQIESGEIQKAFKNQCYQIRSPRFLSCGFSSYFRHLRHKKLLLKELHYFQNLLIPFSRRKLYRGSRYFLWHRLKDQVYFYYYYYYNVVQYNLQEEVILFLK